MKPTIKRVGAGVVKIWWMGGRETTINKRNLKIAIQNIKSNRASWKTEAAYQASLEVYQDALALLEDD